MPCSSIFSDEARGKFDEWALGYLTHLVFRVLHRRGEDEGQASSYTVQILVSPGVSLSEMEAASPSKRGSVSAPQVHTEPPLICTHSVLTPLDALAHDLHRAHQRLSVVPGACEVVDWAYYSPLTTHHPLLITHHPLPTTR